MVNIIGKSAHIDSMAQLHTLKFDMIRPPLSPTVTVDFYLTEVVWFAHVGFERG